MVTYFNKKDLIEFGKYLLSEQRENSIRANHPEDSPALIEKRLREVYHSDVENFLESKRKTIGL